MFTNVYFQVFACAALLSTVYTLVILPILLSLLGTDYVMVTKASGNVWLNGPFQSKKTTSEHFHRKILPTDIV